MSNAFNTMLNCVYERIRYLTIDRGLTERNGFDSHPLKPNELEFVGYNVNCWEWTVKKDFFVISDVKELPDKILFVKEDMEIDFKGLRLAALFEEKEFAFAIISR